VVYSISQSPVTPEVVYAGTDSGLYISLDGGATWALAGLQNNAVTAVSAHQTIDKTVLVGTPFSAYVSEDNGATWKEIDPGLENYGVQAITQDPQNPHYHYLATRFGGIVRIFR
jgi:photosystem II stability/assembly factor-like uncharacterized protein